MCLKYPVLCSEEGCGEKIPREEVSDEVQNFINHILYSNFFSVA